MKIFTNVQYRKVAGVASSLSSFISSATGSKKQNIQITGMDFADKKTKSVSIEKFGKFKLLRTPLDMPTIKDAVTEAGSLQDLERTYAPVIESYRAALLKEKPDFVLINGTYFLPWCLLMAAKEIGLPTVIHYHGSITKETEHWKEAQRNIFRQMEQTFDAPHFTYIFPSKHAKTTVEQEVFGHAVKQFSVLPNPVPLHFLTDTPRRKHKNIRVGIVGRWDRVKNIDFSKKLAQYNQKKGSEFSYNVVTDLKRNPEAKSQIQSLMHLHQPFDHKQMGTFYNRMNVVISPSRFETYGNVPQEALACGTPALISKSMGVAETFRELGLDKWIIDFDSVKDVHAKIQEVCHETVPLSVRTAILEKYSPAVIHSKMVDIFNTAS